MTNNGVALIVHKDHMRSIHPAAYITDKLGFTNSMLAMNDPQLIASVFAEEGNDVTLVLFFWSNSANENPEECLHIIMKECPHAPIIIFDCLLQEDVSLQFFEHHLGGVIYSDRDPSHFERFFNPLCELGLVTNDTLEYWYQEYRQNIM